MEKTYHRCVHWLKGKTKKKFHIIIALKKAMDDSSLRLKREILQPFPIWSERFTLIFVQRPSPLTATQCQFSNFSKLVSCAFSLVNHRGLHQGWTSQRYFDPRPISRKDYCREEALLWLIITKAGSVVVADNVNYHNAQFLLYAGHGNSHT